MNDAEQLAKNRFTILTITRFMDLALVLAGLANVNGQLLPEFTPYLGMFLVIVGARTYGFRGIYLAHVAAGYHRQQLARIIVLDTLTLRP